MVASDHIAIWGDAGPVGGAGLNTILDFVNIAS